MAWTSGTVVSALVGLVIGAIIVVVMHFIPKRRGHAKEEVADSAS